MTTAFLPASRRPGDESLSVFSYAFFFFDGEKLFLSYVRDGSTSRQADSGRDGLGRGGCDLRLIEEVTVRFSPFPRHVILLVSLRVLIRRNVTPSPIRSYGASRSLSACGPASHGMKPATSCQAGVDSSTVFVFSFSEWLPFT